MKANIKNRLVRLEQKIAPPDTIFMIAFNDEQEEKAYDEQIKEGKVLPYQLAIVCPGAEELITPADADRPVYPEWRHLVEEAGDRAGLESC